MWRSPGTAVGTDAEGRTVRYGTIYDPSTSRLVGSTWVRDPFPGNIVPKARWSPVAAKILGVGADHRSAVRHDDQQHPDAGLQQPEFPGNHVDAERRSRDFVGAPVFGDRTIAISARATTPRAAAGQCLPGTPTDVYQWQETPGTLGRLSYDASITPQRPEPCRDRIQPLRQLERRACMSIRTGRQKIGMQNVPGTHFPTLDILRPHSAGRRNRRRRPAWDPANADVQYNGSTIFAGRPDHHPRQA